MFIQTKLRFFTKSDFDYNLNINLDYTVNNITLSVLMYLFQTNEKKYIAKNNNKEKKNIFKSHRCNVVCRRHSRHLRVIVNQVIWTDERMVGQTDGHSAASTSITSINFISTTTAVAALAGAAAGGARNTLLTYLTLTERLHLEAKLNEKN